MRRAALAGEAFRPEQLRAHLALRLGLAQARQRDAARNATYGAAHPPFGGDHLLQEIARLDDGAANTGARNRALLHAGHRGMRKGTRVETHVEFERRAAAVLLDYRYTYLACTCLLPWESRGILSSTRIVDDHLFSVFILQIDSRKLYTLRTTCGRRNFECVIDATRFFFSFYIHHRRRRGFSSAAV